MTTPWNRRSFLAGIGAASLAAAVSRPAHATPTATLDEARVISHLTHRYHGWPTLARRANGELLVVCSGGRETHVCPFGRVELMRSKDEGRTWSWPEVVIDGPIDDRDAGIVETAKGTLLVTTFTSLAYEPILQKAEQAGNWDAAKLSRWQAAHHRIDAAQRQAALGVWMKRSTDGGVNWSGTYDCLVDSPHGPVQLADGRLLYAGKDLWREPHRVGVCESKDDGQTWSWLAEIPPRDGDDHEQYHELHAVETADGRIIVHVRNHNAKNSGETLQSESSDGGETWSAPHAIGVWGLPSHLLRLRDDRLVMSYGHRRAPLGNQARLSDDHGRTWSEPLLLSADGTSGDLGYPSTVQLTDGSLLTVWYESLRASPFAQLRQVHWNLS
ncbi:MAG: sialidase family protein [Planctomycetota bacterium]|nr:sialidase family protein [Planctomycetota bacterium]